MAEGQLQAGTVHKLPADLKKALLSINETREAWGDITPLARNEWICWVEEAKKPETRKNRIERTRMELIQGKRRPCCWMGCPHRTDKPVSPSVRSVLDKRQRG